MRIYNGDNGGEVTMMIATMTARVKMITGMVRHGNGQQQLLVGQLLHGYRRRWMSCYDRSRNNDNVDKGTNDTLPFFTDIGYHDV